MKKFWKVLGITALAAGLTPYKVEKNEDTGENSYQALLWRITSAPSLDEGKGRKFGINLGEGTLTAKLVGKMEKGGEPHLFSDEISVEYNVPMEAEDGAEEAAPAAEEEKAGCEAEKPAADAEAAEGDAGKTVDTAEAAEPAEPEAGE